MAKLQRAFNGAAQTWRINYSDSDDVITQLKELILTMEGKLSSYRHQRMTLKFTIVVHAV